MSDHYLTVNSLFLIGCIVYQRSIPYASGSVFWTLEMPLNPVTTLLEQRVSANAFDPTHTLTDIEIECLIRLATRAPSAYHFQNWRFIAVRAPDAKARLRALAYDQAKVMDAAVTFVICGALPDHRMLADRLLPSVEAGFMPAAMALSWQQSAREQYADLQAARDEAVRSATLAAAMLIVAAQAHGLVSGPMGGFDADGVAREFGLHQMEIPVMLVAVGRAAAGNWPQKPRRPLAEVLEFA